MDDSKELWTKLHEESRYRPKYPSESVVQYVFRNFKRDGKTKILDLGCGAGRHVVFMADENIIPYGIDFSDEGIKYTKELLKLRGHSEYVDNVQTGSLTDIPYEGDTFDGIICFGVLYYLRFKDIKKAVHEMLRVLKPGGKLFLVVRTIEDYRYDKSNEIQEEEHTIVIKEDREEVCAHSENGMIMHFFDEEELAELFSDFENIQIDYIKETHNNQQFCDCNYLLTAEK